MCTHINRMFVWKRVDLRDASEWGYYGGRNDYQYYGGVYRTNFGIFPTREQNGKTA